MDRAGVDMAGWTGSVEMIGVSVGDTGVGLGILVGLIMVGVDSSDCGTLTGWLNALQARANTSPRHNRRTIFVIRFIVSPML